MAVAVIDYGAGNLRSAAHALEAAGAGVVDITSRPERLLAADRIVLPGVGAFGSCIAALRSIPGMEQALGEAVQKRAVPFLGICVGMQLMATEGLEFGVHQGLGWLPGSVTRLAGNGLKVPQIGWNEVLPARPGLVRRGHAYFVHSYAFRPARPEDVAATASYGEDFTAAVCRDNLLGVQFHPEKSQAYGLSFLSRWLEWRP